MRPAATPRARRRSLSTALRVVLVRRVSPTCVPVAAPQEHVVTAAASDITLVRLGLPKAAKTPALASNDASPDTGSTRRGNSTVMGNA